MSTEFATPSRPKTMGPPLVIAVHGKHDRSTVDALATQLAAAFGDGESPVVIDLSDVAFMDSSTLHLLERARDCLAISDRPLALRDPSRSATLLLSICDEIWPVDFTIDRESPEPRPSVGQPATPETER